MPPRAVPVGLDSALTGYMGFDWALKLRYGGLDRKAPLAIAVVWLAVLGGDGRSARAGAGA